MGMSFFLWTVDGKRRKISFPIEFSYLSSVDTPADSLKAVFFIEDPKLWRTEIAQVQVELEGKQLFHGGCDKQVISMGENGCRLTLWARSDAAVLLDNEAIPQEYTHVSLDEIFDRHIRPYGFQNNLGSNAKLPFYRVGKGMSEWEAFSHFCSCAVKKLPYVLGAKVCFLTQGKGSRIILPQNTPILSASETIRRTQAISQVLIRDSTGRYSGKIENRQAQQAKILRRRCLIPSTQWEWSPKDAEYRMERSMQGRIQKEVCLAGLMDWELGEQVVLNQPQIYFRGNIVSRELEFTKSGEFTRLILE